MAMSFLCVVSPGTDLYKPIIQAFPRMGYFSSVRLNLSMVRSQMLENSFLINNATKKLDTRVPIIPLIGSLAKAKFCNALGPPINKITRLGF